MSKVQIEIRKLSKSFGDLTVFKGIDLSVNKGQSLAIIGGSGQGKSVLLKCIVGLINPDVGEIFYNGRVLNQKNSAYLLNSIGILFQGAALFDSLSVWENISFKFKYTGTHSDKDRRNLAKQKLDLVGLPNGALDLFPSELSGGMQKRVGIARAIAANPEVLFFDEPTSGLDPIMANTINKLIREIVIEFGTTAVTISHDLNSILSISDHVALLHEGTIDWNGTITEFKKTDNMNIKEFIKPESQK